MKTNLITFPLHKVKRLVVTDEWEELNSKVQELLEWNERREASKMKIPVLMAVERNKEGHLSVWCPYCERWHHHGIGEGHKAAHCDGDSPFRQTGYIIKKVNPPNRKG